MSNIYQIPPFQGDTALQRAISVMLRRYMECYGSSVPPDPTVAPGVMALRFAWWLFDHPEELEAAAVEMEAKTPK